MGENIYQSFPNQSPNGFLAIVEWEEKYPNRLPMDFYRFLCGTKSTNLLPINLPSEATSECKHGATEVVSGRVQIQEQKGPEGQR